MPLRKIASVTMDKAARLTLIQVVKDERMALARDFIVKWDKKIDRDI
jgi:hypothetical protein